MRVLLVILIVALCAVDARPRGGAVKRFPTWIDRQVRDSNAPQQIYVSYPGDPSQMVVSWVTFQPTASSTVQYGIDTLDNTATGSSITFLEPMNNVTLRYIHSVLITDLKIDTVYNYRCGDSQSGFSDYLSFKTLPNGKEVLNMIVYGDLGLVNSQSVQKVSDEVMSFEADMVLHVGDYAYDLHTNNGTFGDAFMNMIQNFSSTLPYQGCPGNHEGKFNLSHYEHRFDAYKFIGQQSGSNTNWWYSYEYISGGSKVHFASINTEVYYVYVDEYQPPDYTAQLHAQYQWLDQDLAQARQNGADWIIVYGHRPLYCSNNDGDCFTDAETLRQGVNGTVAGIESLLHKYNVDIYLSGHEHSYERTFPIYQGVWERHDNHTYVNPGATTYIITGSAGCQEDYDTYDPVFYGPWSVIRSSSWGYGHFKIYNSTHLYWDQLLDEGRSYTDYLWIIKDQSAIAQ